MGTKGPKGIHRSELVDELTDAIDAINDTKATGKHLTRLATLVDALETRRAMLEGLNAESVLYAIPLKRRSTEAPA